ncbi:hypothetical protein NLI96_g423 [Meripilus lineatus]|uniref:Linoleate diol synthase n=1 Tax=Meripilus lineatus TaxID=2056292 RepID=A0AAD5VI09_9APHY|nr:hypothetical protein NLI96_g423 [Physisporinus lineatus]
MASRFVERASAFASNIAGGKIESNLAHPELTHSQLKTIQNLREYIGQGHDAPHVISELASDDPNSSFLDAIVHTNSIDDRKMLLENVIVIISQLKDIEWQTKLQNLVVEILYTDLPHPPATYLGPTYARRSADGSCNNLSDQNLGKANSPYARSVQQSHPLPAESLPSPGLIFDALLKREDFVKHPAGLSSMMFHFAAVVVHTLFRTSHNLPYINETSSYIDLATLYGNDQDTQNRLRTRNGRGTLHPDVFAEGRLMLLPPAVCVILVLFNRNHNYIAQKLLELNERGTYNDPDSIPLEDPDRSSKLVEQEEDIFQTARLINSGWFASIVFSDYLSAILGMVRQGSNWSLNPFGEIRKDDHSLFERGRGNVSSAEFNFLYRWHATLSEDDAKWFHDEFNRIFPDKKPDEVTIKAFLKEVKNLEDSLPEVTQWTFGGLTRGHDGKFNDTQLAQILQIAYAAGFSSLYLGVFIDSYNPLTYRTSKPAGAFKARGTPSGMRLIEIMGIEQSRKCGVCSLNDFRRVGFAVLLEQLIQLMENGTSFYPPMSTWQFLGLKPYATFLEWNSDHEVADAAQKLYGDIEMLELYPGIQAEEPKPVVEGAGLCPSYTISRAILSDAIAITRGDRYFTADYTPSNLTAWGFADCQRSPSGPGFGSTLGRLLLRALPDHYTNDSTYTWFPFMTPDAMEGILTNLGVAQKYDFGYPEQFVDKPTPQVCSYRDVAHVLKNPMRFATANPARPLQVVKGPGFFISSEDPERAKREHRDIMSALTDVPGSIEKITGYFFRKTRELIMRESISMVNTNTKSIDLARDVLKVVPILWAAELAGIPIRTKENPAEDAYDVRELYDQLTEIYSYLFLDIEQVNLITLRDRVQVHSKKLLEYIRASYGGSMARTFHDELKERLLALGYDLDTLAHAILAIVVGATVEMSQSLLHLVNFYLSDDKKKHMILQALGEGGRIDSKNESTLQDLVLEALSESLIHQNIGSLKLKAKTLVYIDIGAANLDSDAFPDPTSIDPSRSPKDKYLVGDGSERTLGRDLATQIMAHMLRAVFRLPGIRRIPGHSKPDILKR